MTLLSSCWATLSAKIVASRSGFFTSLIFIWVVCWTILLTAALRFSISSPRLPIMIPGLEVWIVTTKFSALLSNSILLIEECLSLFEKNYIYSFELKLISAISNPKGGNRVLSIRIWPQCVCLNKKIK